MRTLFLILLCLIVLAPGASAKKQKDDSSDSTATVQSSSDSKDKSSDKSADSSSKSSSDSGSSSKPAETKSSSDSGYHPSSPEPTRSTPREDPPPTIIRSEPKPDPPAPKLDPPKPVEDTSRRSDSTSYRPSNPDPEPAKYTPPTPSVSDNTSSDSSSGKPLSRKEIKQRDRAAEASAPSDPQPVFHPDTSTTRNTPVRNAAETSTTTAKRENGYHPSTASNTVNKPPKTSGSTGTPYQTGTPTGPKQVDSGGQSTYHPKPTGDIANTVTTAPTNTTAPASTHDTGYRPAGGSNATGNAAYQPTNATRYSPKKQAKLEQRAKDAQAKAAPREPAKPAYKPGPATSYNPGGQTPKTGTTTAGSGMPTDRNRNTAGYHPADRTANVGYMPNVGPFKIGYRPSRPAQPHSYQPPVSRDGRWHYSTPPFVEDGRWHRPQARFPRPCYYGHWAYDYYPGFSWRSCFFYFGLYPYIEVTRMQEYPQETIEFVSEPIYVTGRSYVRDSRWDRIDEALADIRSAWLVGRFDLLNQHVQPESTIAVLIDGEYDYAISSDDYLSMTEDALAELNTVSFIWNKVRERRDGTVMAFADHSYWSNDRARTVYVSYTLKKMGRDYFITEIGSSANPLN